jgi:hypothetical protein
MKKLLFLAFTLSVFHPFAFSQNITIKGKVVDAQSKEGLPSCNVFINGSTIGTNSDLDGNYQFNNLTVREFDLVFSYVGYKSVSKKIVAKDSETISIDVELVPSDNLLTEVQVKSKRDKKWEKQLKKGYVETVEDAMEGKVNDIIEGGIVPMLAIILCICLYPDNDSPAHPLGGFDG